MTQVLYAGFQVIASDYLIEIWDGEEMLTSLPADTPPDVCSLWIDAYRFGHTRGATMGRRLLQHELRQLLGMRDD